MNRVTVNLPKRKIPVFIGEKIFDNIGKIANQKGIENNVLFLIDNFVYKNYSEIFNELKNVFPRSSFMKIESSEKSKSIEGLTKIYDLLIKKKFGRDTTLFAIGGGIIGDLGGFAAATFSRGIKLVQIPTTLLAMVDSSIGGKTGINYGDVKNIVGAFYQPEFILCDIAFLRTLSLDEIISGLGEIVKYAILTEKNFFDYIEKNLNEILNGNPKVLTKLVKKSVKIKSSVVEQDEKENGLRKILNLGHTFAHAYESESNYKLSHGKAVLSGIYSAILLSIKIGLTNETLLDSYVKILNKLKSHFPTFNYDLNALYSRMRNDKKNRDGKIKFVLPVNFGSVALDVEANTKLVKNVMKQTVEFFGEDSAQ